MIELRQDGSIPGKPTVVRIYKLAVEGTIVLRIWSGEFTTDLPLYIEKGSGFRGWQTEFFPVKDVEAELLKIEITDEEQLAEMTLHLRALRHKALKKAQKAAEEYRDIMADSITYNAANGVVTAIEALAAAFK